MVCSVPMPTQLKMTFRVGYNGKIKRRKDFGGKVFERSMRGECKKGEWRSMQGESKNDCRKDECREVTKEDVLSFGVRSACFGKVRLG